MCGSVGKACTAGTSTPQCLGANSAALKNGGTTETCKVRKETDKKESFKHCYLNMYLSTTLFFTNFIFGFSSA